MNTTAITATVALLTPAEIRDALWMVALFERWGSMDRAEAGEWRRRILAKHRFEALDDRCVSA